MRFTRLLLGAGPCLLLASMGDAAAFASKTLGAVTAEPLPPSFEGNRWISAWLLFGLTLICALSIAMLWQSIVNIRAEPSRWRDPVNVNRYVLWGLLCTIICGAMPDTLVLLLWDEVSNATMESSCSSTGRAMR
tara:strand:- start:457 stop:858 length:402 start_codon:yes stop_codon:yes gene_type:complete